MDPRAHFECRTTCRSCQGGNMVDIYARSPMPLADALVDDLGKTEALFPLTLAFCEDCRLVQIRESVDPEFLFGGDYPYYASHSDDWMQHCRANALELIRTRNLTGASLVLEIASNDGYLLGNFVEQGIPVLGIDPAPGPVAAAREKGIPCIQQFFSTELASKLHDEHVQANVIVANNVVAHLADLPGFMEALHDVLAEDGIVVVEVPYVRDMVERCEFDTIYHEHRCYFSVTPLASLAARHGFCLCEVRRLPWHGGSLRLTFARQAAPSDSVQEILEEEAALGMVRVGFYADFADRAQALQSELGERLRTLRQQGNRIAAYGASAKGAMLLNSIGITRHDLEFVVDRNPRKQGRHMPGVHVPILDVSELLGRQPDYTLLLVWNLKDEILRQQQDYLKRGGRFIVPVPQIEIVGGYG